MHFSLKTLILTAILLLITGCNGVLPTMSFPGVYKMDIIQGNLISQDMVDQLRPGLTKRQVNFILGTPLVKDTFDQDRWDYVYNSQPGGGVRVAERITVFFEDNQLTHFTGDFVQSEDKVQFEQITDDSQNIGSSVTSDITAN